MYLLCLTGRCSGSGRRLITPKRSSLDSSGRLDSCNRSSIAFPCFTGEPDPSLLKLDRYTGSDRGPITPIQRGSLPDQVDGSMQQTPDQVLLSPVLPACLQLHAIL